MNPSASTRWQTPLLLACVLLMGFLTYFTNYWQPAAVFWDENYHIASAQKYLHGVYFMEQHPPLGKLLIALGEKIVHPNPETDQFLGTDYAKDFPGGFSFAGYRLFPALFGWLTCGVIFAIFLVLTGSALWATLLSSLYVFDNALIVHLRGAMLESTLLFFASLTILGFLLSLKHVHAPRSRAFFWSTILFGAALGLTTTTKVVGFVLILLVPILLWQLRTHWRQMLVCAGIGAMSFLVPYVAVWQTHFTLGRTIQAGLPDGDGYYQASPAYKKILAAGTQNSPLSFPPMLIDSLNFVEHYNSGVPRLNMCKSDENGSPFFLWPIGARTIDYRWEAAGNGAYKYLYLMSNPVVWFLCLGAVLLAAALLLARVFFPQEVKLRSPLLLGTFLLLYVSYMATMLLITRVMYLYHYFLPLLFAMILVGLVVMELPRVGRWVLTVRRRTWLLLGMAVLIVASFEFYRPLTYYEPITDKQFKRRALLPVWELTCVRCTKVNGLVEFDTDTTDADAE